MLIQQGKDFLAFGFKLLPLLIVWLGVESIFQCPHVVVHSASRLCSDTPYHTPAGISTSNSESYQFRHIFIFDWADRPSLCRQWCNSRPAAPTFEDSFSCLLRPIFSVCRQNARESIAGMDEGKKKDALWHHTVHFIILFRFNAVAERRQWSSAASNPRRRPRARLCPHFWVAKVLSLQICRLRRAFW